MMRAQTALCCWLLVCLLSGGCARARRPRAAVPRWHIYTICASTDGSKVAIGAIRGFPTDPAFSHLTLAAEVPSGRVLYRCEDAKLVEEPAEWRGSEPRLLVVREGMTESLVPASGVFTLDVSTGKADRAVPWYGRQDAALWSPDYREVVFDLKPATAKGPPARVRPGGPDVCVSAGEGPPRVVARGARLTAVVPDGPPPGYRVFYRRQRELGAASLPSGKDTQVFAPSEGVGAFAIAPSGAYAAGLSREGVPEGFRLLVIKPLDVSGKQVTARLPADVGYVSWSPDASGVVCFGQGGVWVYDLARRTATRVGPSSWSTSACVWLPGDRLVISSGPDLLLVDRRTGKWQRLCSVASGPSRTEGTSGGQQ